MGNSKGSTGSSLGSCHISIKVGVVCLAVLAAQGLALKPRKGDATLFWSIRPGEVAGLPALIWHARHSRNRRTHRSYFVVGRFHGSRPALQLVVPRCAVTVKAVWQCKSRHVASHPCPKIARLSSSTGSTPKPITLPVLRGWSQCDRCTK